MISNDVPQIIEPKKRKLSQNLSLIGNLAREDVIERRNPIGCQEE